MNSQISTNDIDWPSSKSLTSNLARLRARQGCAVALAPTSLQSRSREWGRENRESRSPAELTLHAVRQPRPARLLPRSPAWPGLPGPRRETLSQARANGQDVRGHVSSASLRSAENRRGGVGLWQRSVAVEQTGMRMVVPVANLLFTAAKLNYTRRDFVITSAVS